MIYALTLTLRTHLHTHPLIAEAADLGVQIRVGLQLNILPRATLRFHSHSLILHPRIPTHLGAIDLGVQMRVGLEWDADVNLLVWMSHVGPCDVTWRAAVAASPVRC